MDVQKDQINPQHYKNGEIECIVALEAATVGKKGIEAADTANVIKYLWRYEDKNGLIDIDKALWYLNDLRKHVAKREEKERYNLKPSYTHKLSGKICVLWNGINNFRNDDLVEMQVVDSKEIITGVGSDFIKINYGTR